MAMDMEMDLGLPVRTPDSDTDTPPRNPPMKRHHHSNSPHAPGVSYKECMKNHAASIGGHALDGCCEFMPGPAFNTFDPTSFKCAACGCHRNFHRRDPDDPTPLNHHPTPARRAQSPPSASQLLLSLSQSPSGPSDEVNPTAINMSSGGGVLVGYTPGGRQNGNFTCGSSSSSKKRFRTKFTPEQKERMYEFSEKIGWKLKKAEERLVEDFVKEIGVGRSVFKVWMHNNKHTSSTSSTIKRDFANNNNNNNKDVQQQTHHGVVAGSSVIGGGSTSPTTLNYVAQQQQKQQQQQQQHSTSSNVGAGNCGASVVVVDQHHHHHRQFNFANGGGQETQAQ